MASDEEEQADEQGEEEESGAMGGGASEDGAFGSMPTEEQLPGMQQANTTRYAHPNLPRVLVEDPNADALARLCLLEAMHEIWFVGHRHHLSTACYNISLNNNSMCQLPVNHCAVTNVHLYISTTLPPGYP